MNKQFMDIDITNDKVNKIVKTGFEEFGKYGVKKASLNNILKKAGVPKGVFYHYFTDKQELFDFLVYHSMRLTGEYMEKYIDWEETDFLTRLIQGARVKLELQKLYPFIMDFYEGIIKDDAYEEIRESFNDYFPGLRQKFYNDNLDFSNVKEGIDLEKMIKTIRCTLSQLGQEYVASVKNGESNDIENFIVVFEEYILFFRDLFYKK